jgi:hypothetical protein
MRVDGRQCIFGGERDDLTLIGLVKGVRHHHETSARLARKFRDAASISVVL